MLRNEQHNQGSSSLLVISLRLGFRHSGFLGFRLLTALSTVLVITHTQYIPDKKRTAACNGSAILKAWVSSSAAHIP
jgi:hypothetical protein